MVMTALRFDLRNPVFAGTSASERMQAAPEIAAWADTRGCVSVSISEHHGSEDGYLPSPIVFAAALAARTTYSRISLAALVTPFYDPLRLAEDLAVLDCISGGRLDIVLGLGYVEEEFDMFAVAKTQRIALLSEAVDTLRSAWSGQPFKFRNRTVQVTPTPHQEGGPAIVLGGSSAAAGRRAARIADGFLPSNEVAWAGYRNELLALGEEDPGPGFAGSFAATFLAEDVEAGWRELSPYLLHDTNQYAGLLERNGIQGPYRTMTADDIRTSGNYRVVTPDGLGNELQAMGARAFVFFHPLAGGIPPDIAWKSLHLFDEKVRPALP